MPLVVLSPIDPLVDASDVATGRPDRVTRVLAIGSDPAIVARLSIGDRLSLQGVEYAVVRPPRLDLPETPLPIFPMPPRGNRAQRRAEAARLRKRTP